MNKILFLLLLPFFIYPDFVLAKQINLNSATLSQLDELAGIGPVYAQKIIDGRPYLSVDDLLGVKGVGPITLEKIKNQGWACIDCPTEPEADTNSQSLIIKQTDNLPVEIKKEPKESIEQNSSLTANLQNNIYINEILPSPNGADDQGEWIEIFNQNNFEIDLSGWKIRDASGSAITYVFSKNTKVASLGYLVLKRAKTKITLNNTEDRLFFLTPDENVIDSLYYKNAPRNQSYNRINNNWEWSRSLTPGSKNIISQNLQKKSGSLSNSKKSDNNINKVEFENLTANLSKKINKKEAKITNPWFLFYSALAVTLISAVIVLFIKFKIIKSKS